MRSFSCLFLLSISCSRIPMLDFLTRKMYVMLHVPGLKDGYCKLSYSRFELPDSMDAATSVPNYKTLAYQKRLIIDRGSTI